MSFSKPNQIIGGAALLLALWLADRLVPGGTLPLNGWIVAVVAYLLAPALNNPAAPVRSYLLHLATALGAVGLVLFIAGKVFFGLLPANYAFLPIWLTLGLAALLPRVPWQRLAPHRYIRLRPLVEPLAAFCRRRWAARDDLAATGALLVAALGWVADRLTPENRLPASGWLVAAGLWLVIDRWPWRRWQEGPTPAARLIRQLGRVALWLLATAGLVAALRAEGLTRINLAWLVIAAAGLLAYGCAQMKVLATGAENLRRILVAAFCFGLMFPVATNIPRGAGDAAWYGHMVADVLAQLRAGSFPVFVGQSEYLFNGGIYPLRMAPLLQHYAMAVDALSLGCLPPGAVLNLVLILILQAAGLAAYGLLGSLLPARRWLAAGLALLFVSCPGILALAYGYDLYMTWAVLPWIPVAFGGCVRSFRDPGFRPLLEMAAGLALAWWAHAPVALWATLVISAIQVLRLGRQGWRHLDWRRLLVAAATFSLLALYPLVSVLVVPLDPDAPKVVYPTAPVGILQFLQDGFPGIFLPLTKGKVRTIADFQAGWSLLLLIAGPAWLAWRNRVRAPEYWSLLAVIAVLFLLLLPLPGLTLLLWKWVPATIVNTTGNWPMQRFYPLIAAAAVFAVAALVSLPADRAPRFPRWSGWLLAAAIGWSALEAGVLLQLAWQAQKDNAYLRPYEVPENYTLTRYAYGFFSAPPPYFSHGYVEPLLEQRLLSRDSRQLLQGNTDAVTARPGAGRVLGAGVLSGRQPEATGVWSLEPVFRLEPGRRYLLEFDFLQPDAHGVLVVGGHTLSRVYELPTYGEPLAFGATPGASHALPLHSTSATAGDVRLQFVLQENPAARDLTTFARYRWLEYNPADLPVQVTSWIPYQARVRSPALAWLETSRMYQQGYRAEVDGRAVAVAKSPQGLAMLPVPAGESRVKLSYHPPFLLAFAYYASLAGLAAVAALSFARWRQARPSTSALAG